MAVKCPLCGYKFDTGDAKGLCAHCPMGADCNKVCCPNCGYSWLESTMIVGGLLDLAKRRLRIGRS